jgi:5-methyltetrahydrofolate--homocysteine methyltransferase
MTPEEILKGLYDETLVGNGPRVLELTEEGLALDMEPQTLLFDALIPSLEEVGARFERGDFFVPEMLIAGRAMAGAMERLRPLLAETGVQTVGKFLMGTVKGDVHDIGKNLVNIMLEGAGFGSSTSACRWPRRSSCLRSRSTSPTSSASPRS